MKKAKLFGASGILMLLVASTMLFTNCKKGDTGPAGPAGTNGKDGNANVKSNSIFVNANEWVYSTGECTVTKLVPEITSDIISKGAVMVYVEGEANGSWDALPTAWASAGGTSALGFNIEPGKLNILMTFDLNVTLPTGSIPNSNFKVVIIAGSARAANPNVNLENYEEVKAAYNVAD